MILFALPQNEMIDEIYSVNFFVWFASFAEMRNKLMRFYLTFERLFNKSEMSSFSWQEDYNKYIDSISYWKLNFYGFLLELQHKRFSIQSSKLAFPAGRETFLNCIWNSIFFKYVRLWHLNRCNLNKFLRLIKMISNVISLFFNLSNAKTSQTFINSARECQ